MEQDAMNWLDQALKAGPEGFFNPGIRVG